MNVGCYFKTTSQVLQKLIKENNPIVKEVKVYVEK